MPQSHDATFNPLARSTTHPTPTDLLSELLSPLRLRGEDVASWSPTDVEGSVFAAGPARFHFVVRGDVKIELEDAFVDARTGDLVMVPRGGEHRLHRAIDASLVSGSFRFDSPTRHSILAALPPAIVVTRDDGNNAEWLEPLVHFLLAEARTPAPGAGLMISRLIDVLVVRMLRSWANSRPGGGAGWIGGLADFRIERALSAIHARPLEDWTVEGLASLAAMSRSSFSARFLECTGDPPLRYVKNWRLALAKDLLGRAGSRVGEVAREVGYDSEAAFSRAYKQRFGRPPSDERPGG